MPVSLKLGSPFERSVAVYFRKSRALTAIVILLTIYAFCFQIASAQNNDPKKNKTEKPKKGKNTDEENRLDEVRVNFSVVDAEGKPVDDIKAEDLKIFENEKEQKITYLAKKSPVLNLGLVVDNSYSLKPQLPLLTALSKWFAGNLRDRDEGFLIRFVDSDKINILQDWTSDKFLLYKAAEQLNVEGGPTAITDALYLSAEKMLERVKLDNSKRYALIVISDCEDRGSYYKLPDVFGKTKGTDIQIFVVALTDQLDGSPGQLTKSTPRATATKYAERTAAKTGGAAYFPEVDGRGRYTVSPVAEAIMSELRSPYVVGYVPVDQKFADNKRKLRLEVADGPKGEKRSVIMRDGFFFR